MRAGKAGARQPGEEIASDVNIPLRSQPQRDFCSVDNEAARVFLPIIGSKAFAIYFDLLRRACGKAHVSYAASDVAEGTGISKATVWREIQVLEWLGMVRVQLGGGNSKSKCEFLDLRKLAMSLGATERRSTSLIVPKEISQNLKDAVNGLRKQLQGRQGTHPRSFPHRNAIL